MDIVTVPIVVSKEERQKAEELAKKIMNLVTEETKSGRANHLSVVLASRAIYTQSTTQLVGVAPKEEPPVPSFQGGNA